MRSSKITKNEKVNCKQCGENLGQVNTMDKPFKPFNFGLQYITKCPKCSTENSINFFNGNSDNYLNIQFS